MRAREFYEDNLSLIDSVIQRVGRQRHLTEDELGEFYSDVHYKLLKDDFRVVREFRGDSLFRTFLTTLITRELLDYRTRKWGKWTPSAEAKRMGPVAIRLERLTIRDAHPLQEAIELLRTNHGVEQTPDELRDMWLRFPRRRCRRPDGDIDLESVPAQSVSTDHDVEREIILKELRPLASMVQPVITRTIVELDRQARVIFRLHYEKGLSWAQIARAKGFEQRRVYQIKEKVHGDLKATFEAEGIEWEQIEELLQYDLLDLDMADTAGKKPSSSV